MPREIRPPEALGGDGDSVVFYAKVIAAIVSEHTLRDEREVLESLMRVIGHLCTLGGERE